MDAWLAAAADVMAETSGVERAQLGLDAEGERLLLELARLAAHESGDRKNAPLLCYLAGVARARGSASLETLAAAVEQSSS